MLLHIDKIKDTDAFFIIDPITRTIKNVSSSKTTVVQHDHNSERFTFEIPRYIEGHDMRECNMVEVHYINADSTNGAKKGIYLVNDLEVMEEDENRLKFTWLVSNNATANVGALRFSVRFACVQGDDTVDYVWNTAPYNGITVSTGIYNNEYIEEQYPDIIAELFARIEDIDLTTKEDVSNKVNTISDTPSMDKYPSEVAVFEYGMRLQNSSYSYASGYTNQEISNLRTETDVKLNTKEDVSNKIITEDEVPETAPYYSVKATQEYVSEQLSELDKGVEFVDIYFTTRDGGTNVECDKKPSEISNLIESGHNIKLKLNVTGISGVGDIVFICELEQLREGIELYFVSMRSPDIYNDFTGTITTDIYCNVTGDITTDTWSVYVNQSAYRKYVQNYVDEAIQSAIYDSWEEEV